MGKNKLRRFAENETFPHVLQPNPRLLIGEDFTLKGHWKERFFENTQPIVLELGCGKGEYTIGLSERYPDKNYIGIDIKGARIWRGAKTVAERGILNVAFLRTKIQLITQCFAPAEVDEIWITFADPQPKKENKRLTSPDFLNKYQKILKKRGKIHLKTDSDILYEYTLEVCKQQGLEIIHNIPDVYTQLPQLNPALQDLLRIRTHYESLFSQTNTIKYCCFLL